MGTLFDVGIRWKTLPSARRVMVVVLGGERWVIFPNDHYAAMRRRDGDPSVEDEFAGKLLGEHGMTVYRPERDREYADEDGDGGSFVNA